MSAPYLAVLLGLIPQENSGGSSEDSRSLKDLISLATTGSVDSPWYGR